MSTFNRRTFFDRSAHAGLGLAAGATILANAQSVWATPANNKVTLGIIGAGGRGGALCDGFLGRGDCHVAWVADADIHRAEAMSAAAAKRQKGKTPKVVQDFRKVLDEKGVDAVVIATPDHWHAPATIWACQAGKDVYVEKPPTHNCWEGRKMVEAARKYHRIVQVGTQSRSAPYNMAAKKYIEEGKLGKIHFCRVFDQKEWPNFAAVPDSNPPQGFDWDLYNGPAPEAKYNANFRSNWHHFGATPVATSSTTRFTRSTWRAGCWASTIRSRSIRRAGVFMRRARRKPRIHKWPCLTLTLWCSVSS